MPLAVLPLTSRNPSLLPQNDFNANRVTKCAAPYGAQTKDQLAVRLGRQGRVWLRTCTSHDTP